jgi:hypothetical protein
MALYFVKSWTLPKRKVGSWPKGYISTVIDAPTFEAAAQRFTGSHGHAATLRAVEVKDGFTGRSERFLMSGGMLVAKGARGT